MASSNKPFIINQRLEIAFAKSIEYFSSRIEDFKDNDIVIAMPMRNSIPIVLPKGTLLYGRAVADEGIHYSFKSHLIDWVQSPLPVWIIKRPENIIKIQQRNFFRCKVSIPIKYYLVDETGVPIADTETKILTKDLSAGGILIISNKQPLPIRTKLWLEIPITDKEKINVFARVARTNIQTHPDGGKLFFTALQFLKMEELDRRKIINFLNNKILENRSRGLR